MTNSVELRPGQTLVIKVQSKDLAGKQGESSYPFTYEDLMQHLRAKPSVARRSKTPGTKLSRHISLLSNAYEKGVWTTGAPIKRFDIVQTLVAVLTDAVGKGVVEITPVAKERLASFVTNPDLLGSDRAELARLEGHFVCRQ